MDPMGIHTIKHMGKIIEVNGRFSVAINVAMFDYQGTDQNDLQKNVPSFKGCLNLEFFKRVEHASSNLGIRKCHRVLPSVPNGTQGCPSHPGGWGIKKYVYKASQKKTLHRGSSNYLMHQKNYSFGTTDVATVGVEHSWALTCLWCSRRFGTGTSVWFTCGTLDLEITHCESCKRLATKKWRLKPEGCTCMAHFRGICNMLELQIEIPHLPGEGL